MKKGTLLLIICVLLSGCGAEMVEDNKKTMEKTTSSTTMTNSSSAITTATSSTTTTKKIDKNQYISSYDNKMHKYTYVYADNDTCRSKGNAIFLDVSDNINKDVMVYNCEKVTDANGREYYGLFFYTDTRDDARFYY